MKQQVWVWGFGGLCLCASLCGLAAAAPVGTAFTYQGSLEDASGPVDDTCDFRFGLWRDPESVLPADQVGTAQLAPGVEVVAGVFSAIIDFGAGAMNGDARWLEIEVQCPGDAGFTMLSPRVELTPAPHAIRAAEGVGPPNALEVDPATGRVGIGTQTPAELLDVVGNIHATGTIASGNSITIHGTAGNEKIVSTGALEIHTQLGRAWRMEIAVPDPEAPQYVSGPNIIGGSPINAVTPGVRGAAIAGGGSEDLEGPYDYLNQVTDDFGFIGGGAANRAGDESGTTEDAGYAVVGGGFGNNASGTSSVVDGGTYNSAKGSHSVVGGGYWSYATGYAATVGGGFQNNSSNNAGDYSTIGGGYYNGAVGGYSVVCGGFGNVAGGYVSTVPGGSSNAAGGDHSFAAGYRSRVRNAMSTGDSDGDEGTFAWADSTDADFASTGPNQFLIRATGGVGIGTNLPRTQLSVYEDGDDPDANALKQGLGSAGINVVTDFVNGNYMPGLFWSTANNNATKPKAGIYLHGDSSGTSMHFGTSNQYSVGITNDALTIDPAGNVGIATTTPSSMLTIDGTASSLAGVEVISPGSTTGSISISGPSGIPGVVGLANNTHRRDIRFTDSGISFLTSATGSSPGTSNGIILSEAGNVGIGDTAPSVALDVVGDINYTGSITDVSDERLKKNIAPLGEALAKITRLRGVYFNMADTPDRRDVGFIAQNVQEVLPEAVRIVDPDTGYLGVSYPSLIPLLVEAIKEMQKQIIASPKDRETERLRIEISNLKSEIAELKCLRTEVSQLKARIANPPIVP